MPRVASTPRARATAEIQNPTVSIVAAQSGGEAEFAENDPIHSSGPPTTRIANDAMAERAGGE